MLAATILTVIVVVVVVGVGLYVASQSPQTGAVGWDLISLAKPLTWQAVVVAIFLFGFFWEFYRLRSK